MRPYLVFTLAAALLAPAAPSLASTLGTPRFFLGAGTTGTPAYGYQGGWNLGGGVEAPIWKAGHLLLRADYLAMPFTNDAGLAYGPIYFGGANALALGQGDSSVPHATLVATGLRLCGPTRPLQFYADALVGVGHLSVPDPPIYAYPAFVPSLPVHDETNVMLSFGGGARFLSVAGYGLFADVHYDYYYVEAANEPVIPIRIGVNLP
jgi:hypothetical protein